MQESKIISLSQFYLYPVGGILNFQQHSLAAKV
jgi:hypothetical protein